MGCRGHAGITGYNGNKGITDCRGHTGSSENTSSIGWRVHTDISGI